MRYSRKTANIPKHYDGTHTSWVGFGRDVPCEQVICHVCRGGESKAETVVPEPSLMFIPSLWRAETPVPVTADPSPPHQPRPLAWHLLPSASTHHEAEGSDCTTSMQVIICRALLAQKRTLVLTHQWPWGKRRHLPTLIPSPGI